MGAGPKQRADVRGMGWSGSLGKRRYPHRGGEVPPVAWPDPPATLTGRLFGDPAPGRSALDQRVNAVVDLPPVRGVSAAKAEGEAGDA